MVHTIHVCFVLALLCMVARTQWVVEKVVEGIVDRDDAYWVVKHSTSVNRPNFPAYIRFYNTHTRKSEYEIDVSTSSLVHYYNPHPTPHIIFLTTGHFWSEGDWYYITLDEGVLYSDEHENSTEYLSPNFWRFQCIRPLIGIDNI